MKPIKVSRRTLQLILAVIVAALAAAGVIQLDDKPPPQPTPTATPTAAPAPRSSAPAGDLAGREHTDLADSATEREAPPPRTGRVAPIAGCTTRLNTHNFSTRAGQPIRLLVAHYTVSRNVPGWADVNANADFLNRASTKASANAIIDAEGNCAYTVPIDLKAWTQAAANPYSVSIEFVAMGDEGRLTTAQVDRGGRFFADVARREHIPVRLGAVDASCRPTRSGVLDHAMLEACGGGHHDLRPLNGTHVPRRASEDARALAPLLAAIARHSHAVTSTDRVTCRKLNWWRAHGMPGGKARENAIRRRDALTGRGVLCTSRGPVLRA